MAKSKETYNKKEKEQKRFKARQEKMDKMKDRKANKKKSNSLEDMMVYLDENGNLSKTPPDPRNKKIFMQEEIVIGIPKREHKEAELHSGSVSFFNAEKGFGFIEDLQTKERIFFHVSETRESLELGNKVSFQIERGPRGFSAVFVHKLI